MIKAVFFDVDGTLLSHTSKQVPASARLSLDKLREKGIKRYLSTGRHFNELCQLPVKDIPFDGYITLNGQLCLDSVQKILFAMPFDETITKSLVSLFNEK